MFTFLKHNLNICIYRHVVLLEEKHQTRMYALLLWSTRALCAVEITRGINQLNASLNTKPFNIIALHKTSKRVQSGHPKAKVIKLSERPFSNLPPRMIYCHCGNSEAMFELLIFFFIIAMGSERLIDCRLLPVVSLKSCFWASCTYVADLLTD